MKILVNTLDNVPVMSTKNDEKISIPLIHSEIKTFHGANRDIYCKKHKIRSNLEE